MAQKIDDLGTVYVEDDCTFENPFLLFEAIEGTYIIEVLTTKVEFGDGVVYIFVEHPGDEAQPSSEDFHSWLAFSLPLPQYNTYQTFKIAMSPGDKLQVAGSGGTTFHAQGILQA
jgi:hypothetical protein